MLLVYSDSISHGDDAGCLSLERFLHVKDVKA